MATCLRSLVWWTLLRIRKALFKYFLSSRSQLQIGICIGWLSPITSHLFTISCKHLLIVICHKSIVIFDDISNFEPLRHYSFLCRSGSHHETTNLVMTLVFRHIGLHLRKCWGRCSSHSLIKACIWLIFHGCSLPVISRIERILGHWKLHLVVSLRFIAWFMHSSSQMLLFWPRLRHS